MNELSEQEKKILVALPIRLHKSLKILAVREERPLKDVVIDALQEAIRPQRRRP